MTWDVVELVDSDGGSLGRCPVAEAHAVPGRLHRAFSVFAVSSAGRVLLQRRAWTKARFAGLWSNACCGHPRTASTLVDDAVLRTRQELGVDIAPPREAGTFVYRARDERSGAEECEYDHVLVARLDDDPLPDPAEVCEWRWVEVDALRAELATEPARFSPWFPSVARLALKN